MKDAIAYLFAVGNISTTAVVAITLLSLSVTKMRTEFGIISIIISCSMILMLVIRDPVLLSINHWMEYKDFRVIAIASWYILWSVIQIGTIYSCKHVCRLNSIPRTNTFLLFALVFSAMTMIQIMGAIDQLYVNSEFLTNTYRYMVVALDTVVVMMLFTEFLRVPLFDRRAYFQRAVTSLLSVAKTR